MRVRKAIIPAAGLSSIFLPATKAMPKEIQLLDYLSTILNKELIK
jgi:UTP-glucose-1-phosphate uridylyltransferase